MTPKESPPPGPASRRKRRSYEAGHKPKFLVVVDDRAECDRAVYYASRWTLRIGASVVLLRVVDPIYRQQASLSVAETMKAEALEEARTLLDRYVDRANGIAGITPQTLVCEGDETEEILRLIDADEDIARLVLAAGSTEKGPGALVGDLARTAGTYPIPVVIVPGHLTDEELDALS
jgi:nucleotide-binding universal stress UspA family protein